MGSDRRRVSSRSFISRQRRLAHARRATENGPCADPAKRLKMAMTEVDGFSPVRVERPAEPELKEALLAGARSDGTLRILSLSRRPLLVEPSHGTFVARSSSLVAHMQYDRRHGCYLHAHR